MFQSGLGPSREIHLYDVLSSTYKPNIVKLAMVDMLFQSGSDDMVYEGKTYTLKDVNIRTAPPNIVENS